LQEDKNNTKIFGFSAEEVEKLFPNLVVDFNDNKKNINYTGFIPLIVETVKYQQKTIEQLQNENKELKEKMSDFEKRLENIEKNGK